MGEENTSGKYLAFTVSTESCIHFFLSDTSEDQRENDEGEDELDDEHELDDRDADNPSKRKGIWFYISISYSIFHQRIANNDLHAMNKKQQLRKYTPEPEDVPADIPNLPGYRDWSKDSSFAHIFKDIVKMDIPNRPATLPVLYKYAGSDIHPARCNQIDNEDTPTYVYVFDSSSEGTEHARQASRIHKIPQGPIKEMEKLGKIFFYVSRTNVSISYRTGCFRARLLACGSRFDG